MARRIVFIHGAWVTPTCWEPMVAYFRARGYECLAPAWPGKDRPVEGIRADPSPLRGLGLGEIAAHYEGLVRGLDEPPLLVGHSFGGLIVQLLLDRGLGAAGVAIDSAPPSGVWAFEPTAFRALASVILTWRGWQRVVHWSEAQFSYAFVNTMAPAARRAAYDAYYTPETGRIFFQGAFAGFTRGSPCRLDFGNAKRAPLFLIAGGADHIVPPVIVRRNYRRYAASRAVTAFREFPGRGHWILAEEGWQEVAEAIGAWLESPTAEASGGPVVA
jgi:pimeloyl-ACP methyl ester carboxylesterase